MRYLRFESESLDHGEGLTYFEFSPDNVATRQIDVFGGRSHWSTPESHCCDDFPFTDQPEYHDGDASWGQEVSAEEFEALWAQSRLGLSP